MSEYVVRKRITIRATSEAVWKALTTPELTKRYFFNCRVYSTWKEGDPIVFKGRILWIKKIEMRGTVLKADPGKLLQYTLQNGSSENGSSFSTVTDELRHHHGETILTISDDVGEGEGAEKRFKRSMKGWDKVLRGLKEMLESDIHLASTPPQGVRLGKQV